MQTLIWSVVLTLFFIIILVVWYLFIFKDFLRHRHLYFDSGQIRKGREMGGETCSTGPLAGFEPGSATFMACALTTRLPARRPFYFIY